MKDNNSTPTESKKVDTVKDNQPQNNNEEVDYKKLYEESEARRKETQASYTKGQQELKVLKAENNALVESLNNGNLLSTEQTKELDDLKYADPDAWLTKKLTYENEAKAKLVEQQNLVRADALKNVTQQEKDVAINKFLETNSDITLDMLNLDVPVRIQNKLNNNEISVDAYLDEASKFLRGENTKLKTAEHTETKDLNKVPGSSESEVGYKSDALKDWDGVF